MGWPSLTDSGDGSGGETLSFGSCLSGSSGHATSSVGVSSGAGRTRDTPCRSDSDFGPAWSIYVDSSRTVTGGEPGNERVLQAVDGNRRGPGRSTKPDGVRRPSAAAPV